MAEKRGFLTIEGVQDPDDARGVVLEAYLSLQLYEDMYRYRTSKAENLAAVVDVLRSPSRIFETNRASEEPPFGFCYVGSPMKWKTGSGETKRLPKGKALFVYVDSQMQVYEWRFEAAPPSGVLPVDWEGTRFARELPI